MAWPKKHTRKLQVGDHLFLWHLNHNDPYTINRITVGTEQGSYYLFIDPYNPYFTPEPSMIIAAIDWAIAEGWPPETGPTRNMTGAPDDFAWLPDTVRFAYELNR